jgi:hypothetical protein
MARTKAVTVLMHKFEIELEDGTSGEVSAKTEDRWNVGDEVEYEVTPSKMGRQDETLRSRDFNKGDRRVQRFKSALMRVGRSDSLFNKPQTLKKSWKRRST